MLSAFFQQDRAKATGQPTLVLIALFPAMRSRTEGLSLRATSKQGCGLSSELRGEVAVPSKTWASEGLLLICKSPRRLEFYRGLEFSARKARNTTHPTTRPVAQAISIFAS